MMGEGGQGWVGETRHLNTTMVVGRAAIANLMAHR